MARTYRKHITNGNHREVRKGRENRFAAWEGARFFRPRKGGMVMSRRSCGFWGDEYNNPSSHTAKREKRAIKRAERRRLDAIEVAAWGDFTTDRED